MRYKAALLILMLVLAIFIAPKPALAYEEADFSLINEYIQKLDDELGAMAGGFSLSALWREIQRGEFSWDIGALIYSLAGLIFKEIFNSGAILGQLLVLAVICLILTNLKEAFGKGEISFLSRAVVYLLLITITIASFSRVLGYARESVSLMSDFLQGLLPLLMTILAAMGGISSVSILHPAMLFILAALLNMMKNLIFPLIYFNAILRLVGHISPNFNLDKMAGLFKDVALGIMSISLTIFIAFLGLMGVAGATLDGLALRAAKAASGIFIPIVGRSMADALDSVIGTALILKNAIGIIGVIIIFILCALPAVKILAQFIIYRLASAIIQPLGETQLSQALHGLSNALLLLFGAVAASGLLFFFVLALTVGVGNITMMMR